MRPSGSSRSALAVAFPCAERGSAPHTAPVVPQFNDVSDIGLGSAEMKSMKLKLDEEGHVVTKEVGGVLMPVYADGKKEEPFDAAAAITKIKEQAEDLADTEKSSTKENADLKKSLRAWERLGEIKEVRTAVQTVAGLKENDLDAAALPAELANTKAERDALQEQLEEAQGALKDLDSENYELTVGNEIANAISGLDLIEGFTPKEARKLYGNYFKREGGSVLAYTEDGKPVMVVEDGTKPRHATVAEALDQFIPPTFRKSSGAKGSDAVTPQGGSVPGTVRSKADLKGPQAKSAFIDKHGLEAFQRLPLGTPS